MYKIEDITNTIICGHVLEVLKQISDESVDMILTSPPYWGLRDYGKDTITIFGGDSNCQHEWGEEIKKKMTGGTPDSALIDKSGWRKFEQKSSYCIKCGSWQGELGLESTFREYVDHLLEIFKECKRVLKKTGSFYLNIGDTHYGGGGGHQYSSENKGFISKVFRKNPELEKAAGFDYGYRRQAKEVPRKSLCMVPERIALGLINMGWILENKIIWMKPNAMPGSQKDRRTHVWEYIYHFVKNNKGSDWYVYGNEPRKSKFPEKWEIWNKVPQKYKWGCWHKDNIPKELLPGFMNLDYYFDLDSIRVSHKQSTIERMQGKFLSKKSATGQYTISNISAEKFAQKFRKPDAQLKFIDDIIEEDKEWIRPSRQNIPHRHHGSGPTQRKYDAENVPSKNAALYSPTRHERYKRKAEETAKFFREKGGGGNLDYGGINAPDSSFREKYHTGMAKGANPGDVFFISTKSFREAHFCVFPLDLLESPVLSSCPPSGIILDPFIGSGTTAIAALKLGRNFIGIDIKKEYCEMSERRIKEVQKIIEQEKKQQEIEFKKED